MKMFQLELEKELKHAYFFKSNSTTPKESDKENDFDDQTNQYLNLLKKNYIFVDVNNNIIVKNLGLAKKSISPLSKKIFWEHLTPKIKEGQIKFSKAFIKEILYDLLNKDLMLAALRKNVGAINDYKSPSSIQAQISQKYGPGIHFLIPNNRSIGIGKGKKFCTVDEFKKLKLTINDIDLEGVWKELDYFIKPVVMKNIFDFGKT